MGWTQWFASKEGIRNKSRSAGVQLWRLSHKRDCSLLSALLDHSLWKKLLLCHENTQVPCVEDHVAVLSTASKELKSCVCSHVSQQSWKWVHQVQLTLQMTAALANCLIASSWETFRQNHPAKLYSDFWTTETVILNICSFKSVSTGVICYTEIYNTHI